MFGVNVIHDSFELVGSNGRSVIQTLVGHEIVSVLPPGRHVDVIQSEHVAEFMRPNVLRAYYLVIHIGYTCG